MPLSLRCFPARAVARASLCALLVAAPLGLPAVRALPPPTGSVTDAAGDNAEPGAIRTSVARQIEAHLRFLACDDLGGRETGSVQSLATAQYVAAVFRAAGLEPAGEDGDYLQPYALQGRHLDLDALSLTSTAADGTTHRFVPKEDFVLSGFGAEDFDLSGGLVFAGQGLVDEKAGVDDYAGLDVKGRWVVVLDGRPDGRNDLRVASQWRAKRTSAQDRGALGIVTVLSEDGRNAQQMLGWAERGMSRAELGLPPEGDDVPVVFPALTLKPAASAVLCAAAGLDLAAERLARQASPAPGRVLEGVGLALAAKVVTESEKAYNILGRVRGSDPALADEVVILSAHNDHVGILPDGRVNNGADDNASGTTTLLTAAQLLAQQPAPRRSIVFCSVSGEEKGLLGSEWWCRHPTVPLDKVVADINIDMVGRNDPTAVGATPSPEHADYNSLVARAVELAPESGLEITWNAPKDSDDRVDNYYFRSDHYNFAQKGIPVVFFFSGLHEDYHKPTDDIEKIDRRKLALMVDFVSRLAVDVADADGRPHKLNVPEAEIH